ncbi:hypothetical protein JOB18_012124 [Solea senegalensis]|uniref:Uncharacterized protein n=1 Tax=Solea senegalensis TaxID=28829 RepID=A0AAV6S1Q3_SOLSE|nr:hypothetical protein JOB18_012124 [Solea senegalensis]
MEIERLTRLLQEFSNQRVLSQASTCKEETEQELSLTDYRRDPDDQAIKEEDQEVWVSQHGMQAEEFQDVNHSYQSHSVVYETHEQEEDTKPSLLPQTQNSETPSALTARVRSADFGFYWRMKGERGKRNRANSYMDVFWLKCEDIRPAA